MKISIIAAIDRQGVIGDKGDIPWRGQLASDLRRFSNLTKGHPVICGRLTYQSLPARYRPLPDRRNLVLSSNPRYRPEGAEVYPNLEEALRAVVNKENEGDQEEEVFIIGGAKVYQAALPLADRLYLTFVEGEFAGDTRFPPYNQDDWQLVSAIKNEPDPSKGDHFGCLFTLFERRTTHN